jgi:outer membrane protein TolC
MKRALAWCGMALVMAVTSAHAQETTTSLTLEQVVERAHRDSYGAQAARSALEAARARDNAFGARLLPQLSLSGMAPDYNKAIRPVVQPDGSTLYVPVGEMQTSMGLTMSQPIPFLGTEVFVSSSINRVEPLDGDQPREWQSIPMYIGIQQDLFRPRTLHWDGREQDLRVAAAERQFLEAREEVAGRAASAYFDLYAAQVSVANAIANAATNDSLYQISKGRYEVGKIAENDLLQSELAVLRARAAVDATKLDEERATAALRLELNLPDDAPLSIAPPPQAVPIAVDTSIAVKQALANRSEIHTLELGRVQAQRQVSNARLQNRFGARLTAGFGYNQRAQVFDQAYNSPQQQQRFGLEIEMPLVRWGAGRAEVAAARAEEGRVAALAKRAHRQLAQDAYFAARGFRQAELQLTVASKADTVATRRFAVAKDRYVIGKIGIGDLYIAQTEKDAALRSYVEAIRNYWQAYYNLRRVTLYDFQLGRRID